MADSLQLHCHYGGREMLGAETAELILALGTTELWQHPRDVGVASPSPYAVLNCSLRTVPPAREEHEGGKLLLICRFWTRQIVHLCSVSYRARTLLTKQPKDMRAPDPSHTSPNCGND